MASSAMNRGCNWCWVASSRGYSDAADRIWEILNGCECRAVVLFLMPLRVRADYASRALAMEVLCNVSRETLLRRERGCLANSRCRRCLVANGVAPGPTDTEVGGVYCVWFCTGWVGIWSAMFHVKHISWKMTFFSCKRAELPLETPI